MNGPSPPTIYVLAGPNGAGKTSLYQYEALAVPRLNGDSLYQQGLSVAEVEASLRQQLEAWIDQRISFVIETNAASERDYALFNSLKKAGYQLELRYVGLESVAVCQQRVAQRVREGGHDVPPALIQQRYANSPSLPKRNCRLFDRLQRYDHSGEQPEEVAEFLPGSLPKLLGPPLGLLPSWRTLPKWKRFTRNLAIDGVSAPSPWRVRRRVAGVSQLTASVAARTQTPSADPEKFPVAAGAPAGTRPTPPPAPVRFARPPRGAETLRPAPAAKSPRLW